MAQCTDADSDGFYREDGCGTSQDCNDAANGVFPGAAEPCDGFDNDCDGLIDNDAACDRTCDLPGVMGSAVQVSESLEIARGPSIAWTGSEHGAAWAHEYANEVGFARIDVSGNEIGDDVLTGLASDIYSFPSLVWTGSEYGVVYGHYVEPPGGGNWVSKVFFHRLDAAGNKIGGEVQVNEETWISAKTPTMIWTGSHYGIVWDDFRDGSPWYSETYFARLDSSGGKVGTDMRVSTGVDHSLPSDLVWNGEGYGVAYRDQRHSNGGNYQEIYFARLDVTGNRIGDEVRVTNSTGSSTGAALIWTGAEYGLAWSDMRDGNTEVYFARLDAAGNKIGGDLRITDSRQSWGSPSLAWSGEEFGVVWLEERDDNPEVYFARIDAAGNKIGENVRVTFNEGYSGSAALVWTGSGYAVLLRDDRVEEIPEIFFTRIGCDAFDGDSDGAPMTVDCDDTDDRIGPTASQICDDGLNNDCNHPNWPSLVGTNEVDDDGDGLSECAGDCNDADPETWSPPGEARELLFDSWDLLHWVAPLDAGGTGDPTYDVIRSEGPYSTDNPIYYCCIASDRAETWTYDSWYPHPSESRPYRFYVVRAVSACPEGEGTIGTDWEGSERPGTYVCP